MQVYTMMHGHKNIKLCNTDQAKRVYQYKNTKIKLYKNNAAIWYNKTCRAMSPLSIGAMYGSSQEVTVTETVNIKFENVKMNVVMLETCRGS